MPTLHEMHAELFAARRRRIATERNARKAVALRKYRNDLERWIAEEDSPALRSLRDKRSRLMDRLADALVIHDRQRAIDDVLGDGIIHESLREFIDGARQAQ